MSKLKWLHFKHGAWYFVRGGHWDRLAADLPTALIEYGKRVASPAGGMTALIDQALLKMRGRIADNTRKQYEIAGRKLKKILIEFAPNQVLPKHVAQIKLSMIAHPNMANRCLSVLRQVFDYALELQLVDSNPAVGIKRLEEAKRKRLITWPEFEAIYAKAPPRLQIIMDLLFLTGQRVNDVLTIKIRDLIEEGIAFAQQKTGARLTVRWTPELRAVVDRAKTLHGNVRALTLLHNRRGKAPDYSTTKLQWNKACAAAGVQDADLRDLRAMSATATKRQLDKKAATALLGHTSEAMTERYLRDKEIPQVDGPSFRQSIDSGQKH
jgi:integrase